jgi:predicted DNA-binding transcriptional regulator AlpA
MDAQNLNRTTGALLDVNQVADRMCVTPRFMRRLVEERRFPFRILGKFVRFDTADIEARIEARCVEPASSLVGRGTPAVNRQPSTISHRWARRREEERRPGQA